MGGTYGDSCYYDTNMTDNYTLFVVGDLTNSILSMLPDGIGGTVVKPDNITINIRVQDEQPVNVEGADLNITLINALYGINYTCDYILEVGSGQYNCTMNTTLLSAGLYNMTVVSNKTYYNDGYLFQASAFYVETMPQATAPIIISKNGSTVGGWGEIWTTISNITDEDQDNVTVTVQAKR